MSDRCVGVCNFAKKVYPYNFCVLKAISEKFGTLIMTIDMVVAHGQTVLESWVEAAGIATENMLGPLEVQQWSAGSDRLRFKCPELLDTSFMATG